jgi:hypothetical protein
VSAVDPSRWSCPTCSRTFVAEATDPDERLNEIAAEQRRHSTAHAEAVAVLARLGFPDPVKRQTRKKDAA